MYEKTLIFIFISVYFTKLIHLVVSVSDYAGSAKEELDKRQLIVKPDGNLETDLVCCYSEQILHCWCRIIVLQDK
jgi:hypothetical protein